MIMKVCDCCGQEITKEERHSVEVEFRFCSSFGTVKRELHFHRECGHRAYDALFAEIERGRTDDS